MDVNIEVALERCAREPIHIPGAVQPAGMLLVFDPGLERVVQASANVEPLAGLPAGELGGRSIESLLGAETARELRDALAQADELTEPLWLDHASLDASQVYRLQAWRTPKGVIVELEPVTRSDDQGAWMARVNTTLTQMERITDQDALLQQLSDSVRSLIGHERVMVYAFDRDWHGRVVAESRIDAMDSYLGLWFPASDIPPQARAMYEQSLIRIIPDVDAEPAPLVPENNPLTGQSLDLGRALFRAVSPEHLQYLRNMGVGASLSIAIRRDNQLWGLVACHSRTPRVLSPQAREAALIVTLASSQRMFALQSALEPRIRDRVQELRHAMSLQAARGDDASAIFQTNGDELLRLFTASGSALVQQDRFVACGVAPDETAARQLVTALKGHGTARPWVAESRDALPAELPDTVGCGLLAQALTRQDDNEWLLLFRPEKAETVAWAGNPNEPLGAGDRLSPRHSFAVWREELRGRSHAWSSQEIEAAFELAHELAIISADRKIHDLNSRLLEQQDALRQANRELEHIATTDSLTGIWNRYPMTQALEHEIQTASRYGRELCLLLFDLDHFKQVNDQHGHAVGDQVLQALARTVTEAIREPDRFARWGGEEFLVLAPGIGADGAVELAERLRKAIQAMQVPEVERVTASIGVAAWQPGTSMDSLLVQVDKALYAAKEGGRNQVRLCTPGEMQSPPELRGDAGDP